MVVPATQIWFVNPSCHSARSDHLTETAMVVLSRYRSDSNIFSHPSAPATHAYPIEFSESRPCFPRSKIRFSKHVAKCGVLRPLSVLRVVTGHGINFSSTPLRRWRIIWMHSIKAHSKLKELLLWHCHIIMEPWKAIHSKISEAPWLTKSSVLQLNVTHSVSLFLSTFTTPFAATFLGWNLALAFPLYPLRKFSAISTSAPKCFFVSAITSIYIWNGAGHFKTTRKMLFLRGRYSSYCTWAMTGQLPSYLLLQAAASFKGK